MRKIKTFASSNSLITVYFTTELLACGYRNSVECLNASILIDGDWYLPSPCAEPVRTWY
jgi:hypothetical protein